MLQRIESLCKFIVLRNVERPTVSRNLAGIKGNSIEPDGHRGTPRVISEADFVSLQRSSFGRTGGEKDQKRPRRNRQKEEIKGERESERFKDRFFFSVSLVVLPRPIVSLISSSVRHSFFSQSFLPFLPFCGRDHRSTDLSPLLFTPLLSFVRWPFPVNS